MAYVALYRKYRSQSFDELQGQEAVTTTLRNSIASGRFGHAYLFHGARGCGKTSTARLLARALNCVAQDGPTPNPCGQCRLCLAIRNGACLDVVEMDAASETGIDDVREKVIESVQYAPGEGRYKVYIIDEVHDLSAKAFDALLKTLEEPPPHVVFVLATTEYHKVPITIRSRCMGFQFKRGTIQDLSKSIERVVSEEGFSAEPDAVQAIARGAEGSWRDALSILEQVLAYSDGHITAETVNRAVGTVGAATLARVTLVLATGAMHDIFDMAAELLDSGADVRQLLTALQGHLRDLMLLAAGAKQAAQELGPDRLALLEPQATLFTPAALLDMMSELAAAEREVRLSNQHRWILERTLARVQSIGQGIAQLQLPANTKHQTPNTRTPEHPNTVPPLAATPTPVPKPPISHAPTPSRYAQEVEEIEPEVEDSLMLPTLPAYAEPSPSPAPTAASLSDAGTDGTHIARPPLDNSHRFAEEVNLEVIQRRWPHIVKAIEKASPSSTFLQKARVTGLQGATVILSFQDAFSRDRIQNKPKGRELVEKKLNESLKTEGYKIRCILDGEEGDGGILARLPPVGSPGGGAASTMEMSALLDTPVTPVAALSARRMDFDMPTAPPPTTQNGSPTKTAEAAKEESTPQANGIAAEQFQARQQKETVAAAKGPEPQTPAGTGLLIETLNIFGGEVVKTEKA